MAPAIAMVHLLILSAVTLSARRLQWRRTRSSTLLPRLSRRARLGGRRSSRRSMRRRTIGIVSTLFSPRRLSPPVPRGRVSLWSSREGGQMLRVVVVRAPALPVFLRAVVLFMPDSIAAAAAHSGTCQVEVSAVARSGNNSARVGRSAARFLWRAMVTPARRRGRTTTCICPISTSISIPARNIIF